MTTTSFPFPWVKTKQRIPILVCVCVCVRARVCVCVWERERERVYAYQCLQIFIWKHGLGCFLRGDSCLVSFQIHWPIFQIILDSRHYERQQSTTAAETKSKSKSKCSLQTYKMSSEDMDQHCWNQPSRCEGPNGFFQLHMHCERSARWWWRSISNGHSGSSGNLWTMFYVFLNFFLIIWLFSFNSKF